MLKTIIFFSFIFAIHLTSSCHATQEINTLYDKAENGISKNIECKHQQALTHDMLNLGEQTQSNQIEENNFAHIMYGKIHKITESFSYTCQIVIQPLSYCGSLVMPKEFITQVAASITSTFVLYGMYKVFNTEE